MGQAGVNKIMLWERMDLRFVLEASEGMRKNDPIIILFKSTARLFDRGGLMTDALRRKKVNPIQNRSSSVR